MIIPTIDEIDRIGDPILRSLQITQCYYELSQSVAGLTGFSANWCTFATWASKQAGQTIRQEDLLRAFEERFYLSAEISAALEDIASNLKSIGAKLQAQVPREAILQTLNPAAAFARAAMPSPAATRKSSRKSAVSSPAFLTSFTTMTIWIVTRRRASAPGCASASRRTDNAS